MRFQEPIILLGHSSHDHYGHVRRLWECFTYYGRSRGIALVDRADLFLQTTTSSQQELEIVQVDDLFDPVQIAEAIKSRIGGSEKHSFICAEDNITLSYLKALELIGYQPPIVWGAEMTHPWVPVNALWRTRLKPCARRSWNEGLVDPTQWAVLRWNGRKHDWLALGGLEGHDGLQYIVKPVAGEGSKMVRKVAGEGEAMEQADAIRCYYESVRYKTPISRIEFDGMILSPYEDALVEEVLEGPEYTVDGFISNGSLSCIVQHKETKFQGLFIGDGLTVAPPDRTHRRLGSVMSQHYEQSPVGQASDEEFENLMLRGLQAVSLDNWSFHAEVIETRHGLRFVELNPRPAGGLLGTSAAQHLGIDLFEMLVRLHLGIPTLAARRSFVTAEFPIYATQAGRIVVLEGIEGARRLAGVMTIEQLKQLGDQILFAEEENVIAVVLLCAKSHEEIRDLEWRIRRLIRVRFENQSSHSEEIHLPAGLVGSESGK